MRRVREELVKRVVVTEEEVATRTTTDEGAISEFRLTTTMTMDND